METTGYLLRLNYLLMTFTGSLQPLFQSVPLINIQLIYLWLRWVFVVACFLQLRQRGATLVAVWGPLAAVASGVVSTGSWTCGPRQLQHVGSVVTAHGLSCSIARGIFLDQGSNPYLLHWQVDSLPLSHQGSPDLFISLALSAQIRSVSQSCLTLCDPMNPSTPGLSVHLQLQLYSKY